MREYIIATFGILIVFIVGLLVMSPVKPMDIKYTNYSETHCVGKTCTNYLLSQMGNKTLNITLKDKPEICEQTNWAECEDEYIIK